jgi:hypothetical protein
MAKEPTIRTAEEENTANPGHLEPYPTGTPGDPYAGKKAAHPQLHEEAPPPPEADPEVTATKGKK